MTGHSICRPIALLPRKMVYLSVTSTAFEQQGDGVGETPYQPEDLRSYRMDVA
jgi:hypothetical protein